MLHTNELDRLVQKLELAAHPEGGFYKEIYRSSDTIKPLDARYNGNERAAATVIYYLLKRNDFSAWHRVNSDESWQYCSGSSLTLYIIESDAKLKKVLIGNPYIDDNAVFHYTVRNGLWFCAVPNDADNYTLVTCSVSPGFDFADWKLAERAALLFEYPEYSDLIEQFTRKENQII